VVSLLYTLEFETTNNIAEYEALVMGLRDAKNMAIENLAVFGDSELVVNDLKLDSEACQGMKNAQK
jgi:ribonuclease HI